MHCGPALSGPKSTFLIVAPSQAIENILSATLAHHLSNDCAVRMWDLHRLLVADSMKGWLGYMAWIEECLRDHVSHLLSVTRQVEDG